MSRPIKGGIYWVPDTSLSLPPQNERFEHPQRVFLVLSCNEVLGDPAWSVVSGVPLSSSTQYRTRFDVKFSAGEAGLSKKCWARIHAIQPLAIADLGDHVGTVSVARLEEIHVRAMELWGGI